MPVTPTKRNYAAFAQGYAQGTLDAREEGDSERIALRTDAFEADLDARALRAYRAGRAAAGVDVELGALGVRPYGLRYHYRDWTRDTTTA